LLMWQRFWIALMQQHHLKQPLCFQQARVF